MHINDFDYYLPKEAIAQRPISPRDMCKLLIIKDGDVRHRFFYEIGDYLTKGDVVVLNDTCVQKVRLHGTKETGGRLELLVLGKEDNGYTCLIKGKVREGQNIRINDVKGIITSKNGGKCTLKIPLEMNEIEEIGEMPLPPYIREKVDENTAKLYQTVFAKKKGSIASPTAGLHFSSTLLTNLKRKGVKCVFLTLHVGIGTFMPIRGGRVELHEMEQEFYTIGAEEAATINMAKENGNTIIAVGTTTVKAMESAAQEGYIQPFSGWSDLFIYPGYVFQAPISGILTNFHLPKSTPLLLVSAFCGKENIINAYKTALNNSYRFLSFGDAMLILDKNV